MNLTLYLTFDCNQRCGYCFAAPQQTGDMSFQTASEAISVAANAATRNGDHHLGVRFFGGEPLMRWDLIPALIAETRNIAAAHGLRTSFSVSTNALTLNEERRSFLLQNDVAVGISIDGTREVHDRNRLDLDGGSSFELVLRNARAAIDEDLRVELVLVVDPTTIGDLRTSVEYLHDATGADFFILSLNVDAVWTAHDVSRLAHSYKELADYFADKFDQGRPIQIDALNNKMNVLLRSGFIRQGLCTIGQTDLAVIPDGRIYPCLRLAARRDDAYAIGHVATGVNWDSALMSGCGPGQNGDADPGCRSCRHTETCLNWCAAANIATSGRSTQPGMVMCKHEKICIGVSKAVLKRIDRDAYRDLYREYLPSMEPSQRIIAIESGK